MQNLRLVATAAALTDVGLVRDTNEDCVGVLNDSHACSGIQLAVLADGMGGHAAGEIASKICVDTAIEFINRQSCNDRICDWLKKAIALANERIYMSAISDESRKGMGSTICLLYNDGSSNFYYAWVGDSRIYLLRNGLLSLLTRDDTLVNDMLDEGLITYEQAHDHPHGHVITQAVGTKESIRDIHVINEPLQVQMGDRFLMTSDGIHDYLDEYLIAQLLSIQDLHSACLGLIEHAKEAQSTDNLSVVIVEVSSGKPPIADAQSAITRY